VDNDVWEIKGINNRSPRPGFHACPPRRRNPLLRGVIYGGMLSSACWVFIVGYLYFAR